MELSLNDQVSKIEAKSNLEEGLEGWHEVGLSDLLAHRRLQLSELVRHHKPMQ